ncbi:hypothetical protein Tco_0064566 [Tanacetum coccineum]
MPASESEPDNEIEVENPIEHKDETIPVSVYEVGESSTAAIPQEDGDRLLPGFMRRDIDSLFGRMVNFLRRLCGREMAHALVEKKGEAKDKFYAECKKLKKELEEARLSNTFLRMQNERVERDLYWTRVRAHEFYQEMIRRGFVFEERPNEAINVLIEDEKSPLSEPLFSVCRDRIIPPKSAPMTQAAIRKMIKDSVDAAIAAEGRDTALAVRECTFAGFMKCNPVAFYGIEGAVELRKWFEKTESIFEISECAEGKKVRFAAATLEGPSLTWWKTKVATMGLETMNRMPWTEMKQLMTVEFNELALMCPRMVEPERVKVDAYIRGLTDNIKGEVISSKPVDLNEAVRMAHKLMEQKSQARIERILESKKRKWESHQIGNGSFVTYCSSLSNRCEQGVVKGQWSPIPSLLRVYRMWRFPASNCLVSRRHGGGQSNPFTSSNSEREKMIENESVSVEIPEAHIHTQIEPLDLEILDYVIQCFQNTCQCAITKLVYFVEPHDLSFIVVDREDYCSRRLTRCIISLNAKPVASHPDARRDMSVIEELLSVQTTSEWNQDLALCIGSHIFNPYKFPSLAVVKTEVRISAAFILEIEQ